MSLFSFVKNRVSIVDLINDYVGLKKAGRYLKGRCPFHKEQTASFTVSPEKEIFYCFGCHEHGDVISFFAKIENYTIRQAADQLIEKYNIQLPDDLIRSVSDNSRQKSNYLELCSIVAQWCNQKLQSSKLALQYVLNRGINQESIAKYQIGYFPGGLQASREFIDAMASHQILVSDLQQAQILQQGKTVLYSSFEERIIFPIAQSTGAICGFGGRIFKEQDSRPKYYNSHENDYFQKGSLLFGLTIAKQAIKNADSIFLVEGYTDCIALAQYGFTNVVATLGTSCTIHHLKELARYASKLYVMYDSDAAGKQAILRIAQLAWQANMDLEVVSLPSGYDPASFLISGNQLLPLVEKAQNIFHFYIDSYSVEFTHRSLGQKISIIRNCLELIGGIEEQLKQDILLQKAAEAFNIPFASLQGELIRIKKKVALPPGNHLEATKEIDAPKKNDEIISDLKNISMVEKQLFSAIINNIQILNLDVEGLVLGCLQQPLYGIINKLYHIKKTNSFADFSLFFEQLDEREQKITRNLLLTQQEPLSVELIDHYMVQLQKKYWKQLNHEYKLKLTQATRTSDQEYIDKLLNDLIEQRNKLLMPVHLFKS